MITFDPKAIQGDPKKTICLVVTLPKESLQEDIDWVYEGVLAKLSNTEWALLPVFVILEGVRIEAVELPQQTDWRRLDDDGAH